jgi:molecular chaperone GrpE
MSKRHDETKEASAAPAPEVLGVTADSPAKAGAAETPTLEAQLRQKDNEISELKDKYLRALAEQENARKRMRQQTEETIRLQREGVLREFLPIVDNLELAVAAAKGATDGQSITQGVEMVLRTVQDFLRQHGVTSHESVGQPFDPRIHEAVDQVESPEAKPNIVIKEYSRGYRMGDRVLRPARVIVAKAPATKGQHSGHKGGRERYANGEGSRDDDHGEN